MYKKWIPTLSNVELFYNMKEEEIDIILTCFKPKIKQYKKGENIAIAGEKFEGIGVILKGEVMVAKENAAGNRVILAKLQKERMFGEMIAFSDRPIWPATIIVVEETTVMFIEPEKLIGTCGEACISHTTLILNMLKMISKRALLLNRKVEYLAIKGMREKISTYLLEQHSKTGKLTFMIGLNRNELADFLNVSRPSMSREIAKMKDEGIIDYYRCSFKILDLEQLKEAVL